MKKFLLATVFLTLFLSLLTSVQTVNAGVQKWNQPPEFIYPALLSMRPEPIVADDWRCTDPRPVTDVHFWGTYKEWLINAPGQPAEVPPTIEHFVVSFFADIPAGADPHFSYSHPGELLYTAKISQFTTEYATSIPINDICVACATEHKFYYSLILPEPFVQEMGTVYWISISAVMPDNSFPWAWENSNVHWNDSACRFWPDNNYWEELRPEMMPPYPVYDRQTVDMAFALTVGDPELPPLPEPIKWSQFPDLKQGINLISRPGPDNTNIADDWLCLDGSPVSDLHFWGSYPGWFDNDQIPPTHTPGVKVFRIRIYSDHPAASPDGMSRPDKLLYETWVKNFRETYVAAIPVNWIPGVEFEHKYRYDLDLPRIFWQQRNRIYWLNIAAVPENSEIPWGWENSMERWNDFAVRGWYTDPSNWFWKVALDPTLERFLNMSFIITSCPGPAKWLQLPDMANGRNIISQTERPVVADDFLCTNGKPVLEVNFWGSYLDRNGEHWLGNNPGPPSTPLPPPPPIESFTISFYNDIPAGLDPEMIWSHPGELLLQQEIFEYRVRYWDSIPHTDQSGQTWWEHKFYYEITLKEPFQQQEGQVYWLDISAYMPQAERFQWGWETSKDHWHDVAVKSDSSKWNPLGLVQTLDFTDLPLMSLYHVGNTFVSAGIPCSLEPFQYIDGNWTTGGFAQIENTGQAGGLGQELAVNNVNIALDLPCKSNELHLLYGEYGGTVNLKVNSDFHNAADFQDFDGQVLGNVLVSVTPDTSNPALGVIKLEGDITNFAIGGQELWIDEISGRGGCDMAFMLITEESMDYCKGDFYRDADVDGSDLALFCQDFGRNDCHDNGDCEGDFDYNGQVLNQDLAVFTADFGRINCPCNMPMIPILR